METEARGAPPLPRIRRDDISSESGAMGDDRRREKEVHSGTGARRVAVCQWLRCDWSKLGRPTLVRVVASRLRCFPESGAPPSAHIQQRFRRSQFRAKQGARNLSAERERCDKHDGILSRVFGVSFETSFSNRQYLGSMRLLGSDDVRQPSRTLQ